MSDENKEAFKLGFLTRCAEEGLTGEKLAVRLAGAEQFAKKSAGMLDSAATLVGLPLAAGILGGGGIGYGLAKMHEPAIDEDEIKAQEIANTYRVFAERARARKKLRQYRPAK